ANYRLVGSNHRLAGANNGTIRKEQQYISSCCAICCPLVAIYQGQRKDCERKGNENKRGGKTIAKKSIAGKQGAKKSATTSRKFVGKACDRQPYTIIYKRYGSKKRRSGARH
ncbi:hypothetical protein, partial [Alloprevotella tannerae]|uniref:hypothetical protein n=1 Tax=Alloprevotella tannerae TaxID=76122 RepID=UPI003C6F2428